MLKLLQYFGSNDDAHRIRDVFSHFYDVWAEWTTREVLTLARLAARRGPAFSGIAGYIRDTIQKVEVMSVALGQPFGGDLGPQYMHKVVSPSTGEIYVTHTIEVTASGAERSATWHSVSDGTKSVDQTPRKSSSEHQCENQLNHIGLMTFWNESDSDSEGVHDDNH